MGMRAGAKVTVVLAAIVVATLAAASASAEKRLALVVGNDRYTNLAPNQQLQKAVNDARGVGAALQKLGFEVARGENLGRQALIDKFDELSRRLAPGDVVFFFFAGHGVAIGRDNYILPSDVPDVEVGQETRLARASLSENDIVTDLQARNVRVAVVVLDACRNNPFKQPGTRSVGGERGLARIDPVRGVFSLYSAGIGQTALDRLGPDDNDANSVFTRILIPALAKPALDLGTLAIEIREDVARLASTIGHDQRPAYYDETIGGRVYLHGAPQVAPVAAPPPAPTGPAADEIAWSFINRNDPDALRRFVSQFPGSARKSEAERMITALMVPAAPPKPSIPDQSGKAIDRMQLEPNGEAMSQASYLRKVAKEKWAGWWISQKLPGKLEDIEAAAFSPDGKTIAASNRDGFSLWDAETGAMTKFVADKEAGYGFGIAFSPDGRRIAGAQGSKSGIVWDAQSGRRLLDLRGHTDIVDAVAYSRDGKFIATGGWDHDVRVWDATTGKPVKVLAGHDSTVASVAFFRDGKRLVAGVQGGSFRIWNLATGRPLRTIVAPTPSLVAVHPNERSVVTSTHTSGIRLWDVEKGSVLRTFDKDANTFALSPDGSLLATANLHLRLYELATGKMIYEDRSYGGPVKFLVFSPDGRRLVTGGSSGSMRIWDVESRMELARLITNGSDYVSMKADGSYAASTGAEGALFLARDNESIAIPADYRAAFMGSRTLNEVKASIR